MAKTVLTDSDIRARSMRYDVPSGRLIVELTDGCLFGFPAEVAQGLRGASPDDLARGEVALGGRGAAQRPKGRQAQALLTGWTGSPSLPSRTRGSAPGPGGSPRRARVAAAFPPSIGSPEEDLNAFELQGWESER
jgi:hypothetical protein